MSVSLDKVSDGVREISPGRGGNDGNGRLAFIGGVPTRKINGAVIRLAGAGVRCVVIEPAPEGFGSLVNVTTYRMDGTQDRDATWAGFEATRAAWLRYAVANGIYAGTARLR